LSDVSFHWYRTNVNVEAWLIICLLFTLPEIFLWTKVFNGQIYFHWYKILGLLYKRALFDLQFPHNLFWLKLKWNTRSKLFYCIIYRFSMLWWSSRTLTKLKSWAKKLVILVHFKGFNISQKPKSSSLSYFTQKTSLNLAPNWYPIISTCPVRSDSCSHISNIDIVDFFVTYLG
jgi:hypothetical protein